MTIGKSDGNLKSLTWPLPDDCCLTIHYSSNLKHYDIIFKDSINNCNDILSFSALTP